MATVDLITCPECDGSGHVDYTCGFCNGSGEGMYDGSTCHQCKGRGDMPGPCDLCGGEGEIEPDPSDDELEGIRQVSKRLEAYITPHAICL